MCVDTDADHSIEVSCRLRTWSCEPFYRDVALVWFSKMPFYGDDVTVGDPTYM